MYSNFILRLVNSILTFVSAPYAYRSALFAHTLSVKLASGNGLMKLISDIVHISVLSVEEFMETAEEFLDTKNRLMTASF